MRPDNRRCRIAALLMVAVALPAVCSSSAAGAAPWSKVELSAFTTLGILQLKLSTMQGEGGLTLDQMKLAVDGKTMRIPARVDLHVHKPQLNSVTVVTTRTITCIDDECPDPRGWPVYVDLPFGEYAASGESESECEYSLLRFDVEADGVSAITMWNCENGRQVERVLFAREDAADH